MRRRPVPGSVKNVVTGCSDGYSGRVPFARLGQATVAFQSLLEQDFLVHTAAFDRDVREINSQPFKLKINIDGEIHSWLPDYRIVRASGDRELIEVKPIEVIHPERSKLAGKAHRRPLETAQAVAARMRALKAAANENGYLFRLVTEDEIRIQPRLSNAALLLRYAGYEFPKPWILKARSALAGGQIRRVSDLQKALGPELDAFVIALQLGWTGDIELDPTKPYTRSSALRCCTASRSGYGLFVDGGSRHG